MTTTPVTAPCTLIRQATSAAPDISIVMPVFNAGRFIQETLDRILSQPGIAFEIVLIDDGSTDDSMDRIATCTDPRLTVLALSQNSGPSVARNTAIQHARAAWLCPFDADDIMLPGKLAPYFRFVTTKPDTQWGYCTLLLVDQNGKEQGFIQGKPFDLLKFFDCDIICHGMSLFQKTLFVQAGGYDSALRRGEDYDMFLRFLEFTHPVFFNEPSYLYRRHTGNITVDGSTYSSKQVQTRMMRQYVRTFAADNESPYRRLLFQCGALLDAADDKAWADVLRHADAIRLMGNSSFQTDGFTVMAHCQLKQYQEALTVILDGVSRIASGQRTQKHEVQWTVMTGLELARTLKNQPVIDMLMPLAERIRQTHAS